jgi:threonylcarbamoyladenosine tRNA methylthiotransferase MtaB
MTAMTAGPLRVALTSLGCKVNFAEMADLAGALAAAGCDVVPEHEPADVRVLNSCTVTLQADATTRQRLHRLRRLDPGAHIVLTGCSVDGNPDRYQQVDPSGNPLPVADADAVFANHDKANIADHIVELAARRGASAAATALPKLRSRAFIKVQDGCNHSCTYCIVWRARGASRSVPVDTVIDRCRTAVGDGYRELVFCGVDLGSYGRDLGTTLASLLERALDTVGNGARIRLSSINANDVTPGLIELNAHPRLCSHWHMPLQSGSDGVLRAMHRGYRRAQYLRVVNALRARDAHTEFTTDVMVAFPGETDDDHGQTLSLIDAVGFLSCHVFRWSARPGTPASALDGRAPEAIARRRSAEARRAAALSGARSLRRACGREHEVVWDAVESGVAHGIAATYHEVLVDADASIRTGQLARVRAVRVDGDRLRATLLHS